ncbi:MAG: hypothetical protein HY657_00540 [Acidobacteria bacterium]|nr:hypothetical protein [Acidobacteriota bacterium]
MAQQKTRPQRTRGRAGTERGAATGPERGRGTAAGKGQQRERVSEISNREMERELEEQEELPKRGSER